MNDRKRQDADFVKSLPTDFKFKTEVLETLDSQLTKDDIEEALQDERWPLHKGVVMLMGHRHFHYKASLSIAYDHALGYKISSNAETAFELEKLPLQFIALNCPMSEYWVNPERFMEWVADKYPRSLLAQYKQHIPSDINQKPQILGYSTKRIEHLFNAVSYMQSSQPTERSMAAMAEYLRKSPLNLSKDDAAAIARIIHPDTRQKGGVIPTVAKPQKNLSVSSLKKVGEPIT
ncbi:MAG: hypothetical protein EBQ92_00030 [Proteobacteria bacterium]|nr:hypothetical protein [Pseudomonadota bacterium]